MPPEDILIRLDYVSDYLRSLSKRTIRECVGLHEAEDSAGLHAVEDCKILHEAADLIGMMAEMFSEGINQKYIRAN